MSNYRHYFALEKQLKKAGYSFNRSDLIKQHTGHKKSGLTELTHMEYTKFIQWIQTTYKSVLDGSKKSNTQSYKAITHYLCLMGYVTGDNRPDFDRINDYVKNIGSNNPRKVTMNHLDDGELNRVVTQVKAMYKKEVSK